VVDLFGSRSPGQAFGLSDGAAIGIEVLSSAKRAGAVAGGESDGLVEEEERGPCAGPGERMFPISELEPARDPGVGLMMANDFAFVVDETAAVAGEGPPWRDGMEIAPRVDPVAKRHFQSASQAAMAWPISGPESS
jgi:hypothetical protein